MFFVYVRVLPEHMTLHVPVVAIVVIMMGMMSRDMHRRPLSRRV